MVYTTYSVAGILWILALGGTLQGFETSSMAAFIGNDVFLEYFNFPGSVIQGIISGAQPVGAFIGCWVSGLVSDRFGRIAAMRVAALIWIVGSVTAVLVQNVEMLVIGRAVKGVTVGIFSSLLPVYVAEVIPSKKRGLATSVMQWCLTWGIMIMFYLSYSCTFLFDDDRSFRLAWGIELVPGSLLLFLSIFLPESPKWHASRSNWKKASDVMRKLNLEESDSSEVKEPSPELDESPSNLNSIENVLDNFENYSQKCTYADLFRSELRPHLFTGMLTQIFTQLSGISVLMYYLIFICDMIGLTGEIKVISASIQYVINVLFTIFPIVFIDKIRRKDVLVYGASSLGACIGAVGVIMGYFGHSVSPIDGNESVVWEVSGKPGQFCLALCFLFVAIFASTLSCASWLYTNEIFPTRAKSKGSAICMSVSWSFNVLLMFSAPISLKYLKWGTFCLFGVFCIVGALVMALWFPETFELSDNQIEGLFAKSGRDILIELETQHAGPESKESTGETQTPPVSPSPVNRTDSIKMSHQTYLPPPPNSQPSGSQARVASIRTFRNGNSSSPLLNSNRSRFDLGNQDENHNPDSIAVAGHYYMGTNESPFLSNYNTSSN